MNESKGSIDGKRNQRLQNLFIKRKKKIEQIKEDEIKEKELEEKKKKEKEQLLNNKYIKDSESNNKDNNETIIKPVSKKIVVKPKFGEEKQISDKSIIPPKIEKENKDIEIDLNKSKKIDDLNNTKQSQEGVVVKVKSKFGIEDSDKNKEKDIINNDNDKKIDELESIEEKSKINEQDNKVNDEIKEEKKLDKEDLETKKVINNSIANINRKELLELAVVNEFEVILKNHRYDLNNLIIDYNVLKKEVDNAIEVGELDKISEEIDELVRKLEIIKKEMALLTSSGAFNDIYKLHDPYLENIIDEYKESLLYSKEVLDTVTNLENNKLHVSIINKINEFEKEKDKLTKKLNDTKEKYEIRDEDFIKWKVNYLNIEDINKNLDNIATLADEKLAEIEELVNKSVDITEVVEHRMMGTLEILTRTMIIMAMLRRNPMMQANVAMAGGTLATFNAIRHMINPNLGTRTRLVADITDYKDMIVNTMNDTENINQLINDSLSDVSRMKTIFEDEFKEYQYDFPEYKEIFEKIDKIEKEMFERKQNMVRISHELEYQYNKNNAKVKQYENLDSR